MANEYTPRATLFALSSLFPYTTCQGTYLLDQHTEQIRAFQYMYNFLNTYYDLGSVIPVTGRLDPVTLEAVETFQRAVSILPDRKIGCKTWDTIKSMTSRLHMYYMGMVTEGALLPLPIYRASNYEGYSYYSDLNYPGGYRDYYYF